MAKLTQTKSLKSLAIFASWLLAAGLWGCVGGKGLATGDSEGGVQQGAALDDIAREDRSGGGLDTVGDGPGGFTGPGGGMNGNNPGGGGAPGSSDPFGGVDVSGGGGNAANGSPSDCTGTGGVCSADTPVGVLVGYFNITVSLHPDPETNPSGNCNGLFPPPIQKRICHPVSGLTKPGVGSYLASLWVGNVWARPRINGEINGGDVEIACSDIPIPPTIDPSKVPHVVIRSDRPFHLGSFGNPLPFNEINFPSCQADGSWSLDTGMIWVVVSPYPDGPNTWNIDVDAQYPKNKVWESRGTKHLIVKCGWDDNAPSGVSCHQDLPRPDNALQGLPVQGILKSN